MSHLRHEKLTYELRGLIFEVRKERKLRARSDGVAVFWPNIRAIICLSKTITYSTSVRCLISRLDTTLLEPRLISIALA